MNFLTCFMTSNIPTKYDHENSKKPKACRYRQQKHPAERMTRN